MQQGILTPAEQIADRGFRIADLKDPMVGPSADIPQSTIHNPQSAIRNQTARLTLLASDCSVESISPAVNFRRSARAYLPLG